MRVDLRILIACLSVVHLGANLAPGDDTVAAFRALADGETLSVAAGDHPWQGRLPVSASDVTIACPTDSPATFHGSRTPNLRSLPPADEGDALFVVTGKNVTFSGRCVIQDVQWMVYGVDADGLTIRPGMEGKNVRYGIDCRGCDNVEVDGVRIVGFSKPAVRFLDGGSIHVLNVFLDSRNLVGDDFASGIVFAGTEAARTVRISGGTIQNLTDDDPTYRNGDGVVVEANWSDIRIEGLTVIQPADAGIDIKGSDAIVSDVTVTGGKRNFRFWNRQSETTCIRCRSVSPVSKGDSTTPRDLWYDGDVILRHSLGFDDVELADNNDVGSTLVRQGEVPAAQRSVPERPRLVP